MKNLMSKNMVVMICIMALLLGSMNTMTVSSAMTLRNYSTTAIDSHFIEPFRVVILANEEKINNENPHRELLKLVGVMSETYTKSDFFAQKVIKINEVSHVIIPSIVSHELTNIEISLIEDWVSKGLNIVIEGKSELAERLKLEFSNEKSQVSSYKNINHPDTSIKYRKPVSLYSLVNKGKLNQLNIISESATSLSATSAINTTMEAVFSHGKGKVLYLAVSLDQPDLYLYDVYPYLHETLMKELDVKPLVKRDGVIFYFDWGYHYADDPKALAQKLYDSGVTEIHFSMWYQLDKIDYFLPDFIDACHAHGIKVIAWTEYPMVTQEFWDEHPEWREKTGLLEDATIAWRRLMALDNPETMEAVKKLLIEFMEKYNFDGIDLAEIYFESPRGFEYPSILTPFNDYSRETFKKLHGYDSLSVVDPNSNYYFKFNKEAYNDVVQYRVDLITRINREFVEFVKELNEKRDLESEIYLTVIDSVMDEEIVESIGIDSYAFAKMVEEYDIKMIIEDPYKFWDQGPERYTLMSGEYAKLTANIKDIIFDINIIDRNILEKPGEVYYPTDKQTGIELFVLASNASLNSGVVCLYAYNTVKDSDLAYLPYAVAFRVEVKTTIDAGIKKYTSSGKEKFKLLVDTRGKDVYVDGEQWALYSDTYVIVPKGNREIVVRDREQKGINEGIDSDKQVVNHVTDFTADIIFANTDGNKSEIAYHDNGNVYMSLNYKPERIYIDNEEVFIKYIFNDGTFVYTLPSGYNTVQLEGEMHSEVIDIIFGNRVVNIHNKESLEGEMMVSVTDFLSNVNIEFEYNSEFKTISFNNRGYFVWMQANNMTALANSKDVQLTSKPYMKDGLLYAPVKSLMELLNYRVDWDGEHSIIYIH